MAVYTLPNGSEYNTGYSFFEQPDTGSYEFMTQVEMANTPVCTYLSGSNPNIPRVKTKTHTESGYENYDYIRKTEFGYTDNTYVRQTVTETFEIQSK